MNRKKYAHAYTRKQVVLIQYEEDSLNKFIANYLIEMPTILIIFPFFSHFRYVDCGKIHHIFIGVLFGCQVFIMKQ